MAFFFIGYSNMEFRMVAFNLDNDSQFLGSGNKHATPFSPQYISHA